MNVYIRSVNAAVTLACSLAATAALAAPAIPTNGFSPEQDWMSDLFIGSITGSYDATTGDFSMSGTASALDLGPGTASDFIPFIAPTTITGLQINNAGEVVTEGDLTVFLETSPPNAPAFIPGAIAAAFPLGFDLLTGKIRDVGFFGGELQMLVEITGGSAKEYFSFDANDPDPALIPPFPPSQPVISLPFSGLLLNGTGATDFTADFSFSGAVADLIGPVPEPTSAAVWAAVVTGLACCRRR